LSPGDANEAPFITGARHSGWLFFDSCQKTATLPPVKDRHFLAHLPEPAIHSKILQLANPRAESEIVECKFDSEIKINQTKP
jgi:hypothetical protein